MSTTRFSRQRNDFHIRETLGITIDRERVKLSFSVERQLFHTSTFLSFLNMIMIKHDYKNNYKVCMTI